MNKIKSLISKLISTKIKKYGKNNSVITGKNVHLRKVRIKIYGDNNTVKINDNAYLHNVYIRIGFPDCHVKDCHIEIGSNTSFNSADIQIGEEKSSIIIGDDCMFSFNVEIACSDTHSIFDKDTRKLLNRGKNINIGNNCWICKNVKILKNTSIADNCIVAQDSIVTKQFKETNAILAGNPAKIVKHNVIWSRKRPNEFIEKENINA